MVLGGGNEQSKDGKKYSKMLTDTMKVKMENLDDQVRAEKRRLAPKAEPAEKNIKAVINAKAEAAS